MSNGSKETSLIDMKTHYKAMKIKHLVLDHEQRDRSIESNRSFMNRLMLINIQKNLSSNKGGISIFILRWIFFNINEIGTTGQSCRT